MRRFRVVMMAMVVALLVTYAVPAQAAVPPNVTITLLSPPAGGVLVLNVGASHTFQIQVTSDTPFILAMALTDAYYPGRGVFWHGSDVQAQATQALLQLTMTGKASTTDDLPVAIAVGVRFKGGLTLTERFDSYVQVP